MAAKKQLKNKTVKKSTKEEEDKLDLQSESSNEETKDVNELVPSDNEEEDQDVDMDDDADDEDADEEYDESDDDNMDIDGKKKSNKYDTDAFSSAMTNILASSLSGSDKKQPILARSKGVERKIEDEKLDYKARKILSAQKKALQEKGRVIPDYTTFEYEKRLRKVATRGVVKLFNAIRTQQKMTEIAVESAASSRRTLASIEKAKKCFYNVKVKLLGSIKIRTKIENVYNLETTKKT
ncbi:MAG: ribosomal RNA-processing protein [Benjaminiella poitrasii]|nr:MAG: ribosomal RNA-processing protein [Benjaminiella poitrasii]